jgi:hypothetical protein
LASGAKNGDILVSPYARSGVVDTARYEITHAGPFAMKLQADSVLVHQRIIIPAFSRAIPTTLTNGQSQILCLCSEVRRSTGTSQ